MTGDEFPFIKVSHEGKKKQGNEGERGGWSERWGETEQELFIEWDDCGYVCMCVQIVLSV